MTDAIQTDCKQAPGVFMPVIDRNKCEGKRDCVDECPYDVFEIAVLPPEQRKELSFMGKLKGVGHGWQQAFAVNADACRACGQCVSHCPEKAIKLARAA
jgi:NAD-dependent dihydropyrimidine dehydrogenase PreA subunit